MQKLYAGMFIIVSYSLCYASTNTEQQPTHVSKKRITIQRALQFACRTHNFYDVRMLPAIDCEEETILTSPLLHETAECILTAAQSQPNSEPLPVAQPLPLPVCMVERMPNSYLPPIMVAAEAAVACERQLPQIRIGIHLAQEISRRTRPQALPLLPLVQAPTSGERPKTSHATPDELPETLYPTPTPIKKHVRGLFSPVTQ